MTSALPGQSDKLARLDQLFAHALSLEARADSWLETLGEADAAFAPTIRALLKASREGDSAFDTISSTRASFLDALFRQRAEPLPAGAQVGPFVIDALLGRGGFAHVYKAQRNTALFEQVVALKVFDAPVSTESEARRFADECSALARLDHPNIARIIDGGGEASGRAWIAMEHVDGQPVTQALKAKGEAERLAAACQVASALADAHRQLVLHLDIKPGNVLLDTEGRVRVLDFGLAQLMEPARGDLAATGGVSAMTPAYAAPEQREGQALSVATDVYMLGGLLAELLTGERPEEGSAEGLDALPQPLRQIIETCRASDPQERYASVDRVISDLERYQQRLPISLSNQPNRDLAVAFVRRNPWIAGLSLVIVLTLAGWALTSSYLSGLYEQERDRALAEQATAQATTEAVLTVFRRADPLELDTALQPDANAWQYLAAAAEGLRDTLRDEPEALIEVLTLAEALHTRADQLDAAAALRGELSDMTAAYYGVDSLEAAMAELAAAGPLAAQAGEEGRAALIQLKERLAPFEQSSPDRVAYGYLLLAYAWRQQGDEAQAFQLATQALETGSGAPGGPPNTLIEARLMLGQIANQAGRPEEAIDQLDQAVSLTEEAYGVEHARIVGPLSGLAAAHRALGDFDVSVRQQRRAIAIQTGYDGAASETVLALRNNLAMTYRAAGLADLAEAEQRELLEIEAERSNGRGFALASRYQNLASTLEFRGAHIDAREAYTTAARLFEDALSPQNATRWLPYVSLTRVNLKLDDAEGARQAADTARAGLSPILPADHFVLDVLTCLEGASRSSGPDPVDRQALIAAAERLEPRPRRAEERGFCLTALNAP